MFPRPQNTKAEKCIYASKYGGLGAKTLWADIRVRLQIWRSNPCSSTTRLPPIYQLAEPWAGRARAQMIIILLHGAPPRAQPNPKHRKGGLVRHCTGGVGIGASRHCIGGMGISAPRRSLGACQILPETRHGLRPALGRGGALKPYIFPTPQTPQVDPAHSGSTKD